MGPGAVNMVRAILQLQMLMKSQIKQGFPDSAEFPGLDSDGGLDSHDRCQIGPTTSGCSILSAIRKSAESFTENV